jgi:uncharacterized phage-associated protein
LLKFMRTAFEVAQYMLKLSSPECVDFISSLKLQKLLYYARGGSCYAWQAAIFTNGPVVPEVYRYYKDRGASAIPVPVDFDGTVFAAEEQEVIDEVIAYYGQFSAWKLRDMALQERPWLSVAGKEMIPKGLIREFFRESILG